MTIYAITTQLFFGRIKVDGFGDNFEGYFA